MEYGGPVGLVRGTNNSLIWANSVYEIRKIDMRNATGESSGKQHEYEPEFAPVPVPVR
jgi:hypothetical protein